MRVEGAEVFLKVPKHLRKALKESLNPGEKLVASGNLDTVNGSERRVVWRVRVAGGAECVSCPIRVCARKNCWRNGGKELWKNLERQIAAAELGGVVKLKAVDCLDECKHGPTAECAGRIHRRCAPHDAAQILAPFLDCGSPQTLLHQPPEPVYC